MRVIMILHYAPIAAASLLGVLALIGLTAKLARQRLAPRAARTPRALVLTETIAIDPRRRLHLIECQQRRVLLLTGGGQDLVVGWLPDR